MSYPEMKLCGRQRFLGTAAEVYSNISKSPTVEHRRRQGVAETHVHDGNISQDTPTVYSVQGTLQHQPKALWQKYSRRRPRRVLRAGDVISYPEMMLCGRQRFWGTAAEVPRWDSNRGSPRRT